MNSPIKRFIALVAALVPIVGLAGIALAGDLEPPGPPGPTMKTLDEIPPTWSQVLPASERFQVVMNGEAVLDRETGLVWEKAPDSSTARTWYDAVVYGHNKNVGGRKGWRLPAVEELLSLIDPNSQSGVKFPSGHPFTNVLPDVAYWSSTTDFEFPSRVFYVNFRNGNANFFSKVSNGYVWCVRGGYGHDGQ
jgi:hypothetical protein